MVCNCAVCPQCGKAYSLHQGHFCDNDKSYKNSTIGNKDDLQQKIDRLLKEE